MDAVEKLVRSRFEGSPEEHIQTEIARLRGASQSSNRGRLAAYKPQNERVAFRSEAQDREEERDPDAMTSDEKAAMESRGKALAARRRSLASALTDPPEWRK